MCAHRRFFDAQSLAIVELGERDKELQKIRADLEKLKLVRSLCGFVAREATVKLYVHLLHMNRVV